MACGNGADQGNYFQWGGDGYLYSTSTETAVQDAAGSGFNIMSSSVHRLVAQVLGQEAWHCDYASGVSGPCTFDAPPLLPATTVAGLGSASPANQAVIVTDATAITGATCVGGGSIRVVAVSDGTNWKCP
jgi:hypothetical protein